MVPQTVLDFWFAPGREDWWFKKDAAVDALVEKELGACHRAAIAGKLDPWRDSAAGSLALVILFDQVPRNIHRGRAAAYASDEAARAVSRHALETGFDLKFEVDQRYYFYLPLEHSEDLADQERCCRLMAERGNDKLLDYSERHRAIIVRFGRFPHRNAVLGRASTAEETAFLEEPESGF